MSQPPNAAPRQLFCDRVELDVVDSVATITLARPQAGNALDLAMADGLAAAVAAVREHAANRRARVVVLAARGSMFCVGGDLQHFADAPDRGAQMRKVADQMAAALTGLADLPVPVVSVVAGTAAGGGVGVALAADIVVVGPRTKFKLAYLAAGLSPDCGATFELVARLGTARALDLVLTDRLVDGTEAARLGLATVFADDPQEAAISLAARMARGSFDAQAAGKRLLRTPAPTKAQQLAAEVDSIVDLITGPDGKEGVDAFLAKRKPAFR